MVHARMNQHNTGTTQEVRESRRLFSVSGRMNERSRDPTLKPVPPLWSLFWEMPPESPTSSWNGCKNSRKSARRKINSVFSSFISILFFCFFLDREIIFSFANSKWIEPSCSSFTSSVFSTFVNCFMVFYLSLSLSFFFRLLSSSFPVAPQPDGQEADTN